MKASLILLGLVACLVVRDVFSQSTETASVLQTRATTVLRWFDERMEAAGDNLAEEISGRSKSYLVMMYNLEDTLLMYEMQKLVDKKIAGAAELVKKLRMDFSAYWQNVETAFSVKELAKKADVIPNSMKLLVTQPTQANVANLVQVIKSQPLANNCFRMIPFATLAFDSLESIVREVEGYVRNSNSQPPMMDLYSSVSMTLMSYQSKVFSDCKDDDVCKVNHVRNFLFNF